jgi:hypothetical protein
MGILNLIPTCTYLFGNGIFIDSLKEIDYLFFDSNIYIYTQYEYFDNDLNNYKKRILDALKRDSIGKENFYIFDNIPIYAKVVEQTHRRKLMMLEEKEILNKYSDLFKKFNLEYMSRSFLNLCNDDFIKFINDIKKELNVNTVLENYEGEQKISYMIHDLSLTINNKIIVVNSIDGDVLIILLLLYNKYPNNKIYFYQSMFKKYIDISLIHSKLINMNFSIMSFVSKILLFGSDFHPSINNQALDKYMLKKLLQTEDFIDQSYSIDVNKLITNINIMKDCFKYKSDIKKENNIIIDDSDKEIFIKTFKEYYKEENMVIRHTTKDECMYCDDVDYSDISNWFDVYVFVIKYFNNETKGLNKLYYKETIGPKYKHLIDYLENYNSKYIIYKEPETYKMSIEDYKQIFLEIMNKNIKIIPVCEYIQTDVKYKSKIKFILE